MSLRRGGAECPPGVVIKAERIAPSTVGVVARSRKPMALIAVVVCRTVVDVLVPGLAPLTASNDGVDRRLAHAEESPLIWPARRWN